VFREFSFSNQRLAVFLQVAQLGVFDSHIGVAVF
jgi:hypothetical protein